LNKTVQVSSNLLSHRGFVISTYMPIPVAALSKARMHLKSSST